MIRLAALSLLSALALSSAARAQTPTSAPFPAASAAVRVDPTDAAGLTPLTLTVDEAVQIALEQGYAVRQAALDVATANAQIREAYGQLLPRASLSSSFTRNVVSANPFAGSSAGGLFGSLGALDWLAYNESARTDDDASTEPLTLEEFRRRQAEGQEAAGIVASDNSNPFSVPNAFRNDVSISQPLYSGTAFAAVRGARSLREINEAALEQRQDEVVFQTRQLFYGALLAQRQVEVTTATVGRARETVDETALRVAQGVSAKFDRLTAEVDLANLESLLITAESGADAAVDNLLFVLGLPVDQPVVLRGALDVPAENELYRTAGLGGGDLGAAVATALGERPDLRQARLAVRLQEVQRSITRAGRLPSLSAFVNLGFTGSIPDDRSVVTQTGPFDFEVQDDRSFFSGDYFDPSLAVGLSLQWNLFDGFQTRYRVQQNTLAIQRAEITLAQAEQGARLEVAGALRTLESARRRALSQGQNVERAALAYDFAIERLRNGVSTQIEVRQASTGLDQAQLGFLQAAYDVLVARAALERATGTITPLVPPPAPGDLTLRPTPPADAVLVPIATPVQPPVPTE